MRRHGGERGLQIGKEDERIVEKQLATAVGSCFFRTILLCIDFQKNLKPLPAAVGSCFGPPLGVNKRVPKMEFMGVRMRVDCEDTQRQECARAI